MPKFYVYQLRAATQILPFYIGKGTGNRKNQHLTPSSLKVRSHKSHTIKYYQRLGIEVLTETLFEFENEKEAFAKEAELIRHFGRRDLGTGCLTNRSDGADGGPCNRSAETREKVARHFRGKKRPPEHVRAVIAAITGKKRDTRAKFNQSRSLIDRTRPEDEVDTYSKYTRRQAYEHVKAWAQSGATITSHCALIGVGQSTFQRWRLDRYVLEHAKQENVQLPVKTRAKGRQLPPQTEMSLVISLITEWENSQMSITQFCQTKNLNVGTFRSWRKNPFVKEWLQKAPSKVFSGMNT